MLALVAALAAAMPCACQARPAIGRKVIVLGLDGLDYDLTRQMIDERPLAGVREAGRLGRLRAARDDDPAAEPRRLVELHHRSRPGRPRHLRLHPSRSEDDAAVSVHDAHRGRVAHDRAGALAAAAFERHGSNCCASGQPFWERARGARRADHDHPHAGELSASGSRHARAERHGHARHPRHVRHVRRSTPPSRSRLPVRRCLAACVHPVKRARRRGAGARSTVLTIRFFAHPEKVQAEFTAQLDGANRHVKIVVGTEERLLAVGEWSDWVPVSFPLAPTQSLQRRGAVFSQGPRSVLRALCQSRSTSIRSIRRCPCRTRAYAAELAEATGRFYTQGMPEDTKGLKTGVLTDAEFLAQARIAGEENLRQYDYVLDQFTDGLLFYYFGNVDQVSHMMWRARDPRASRVQRRHGTARTRASIEELYQRSRCHRQRDAGATRAGRPAGGDVGSRLHVVAPGVPLE